jgi:uncharacterized membrane protein YphA (DoxX/SURF4 family)
MTVSNKLARPMLAALFVYGGWDSFRNPASKAHLAEPIGPSIAEPLGLPTDPEQLVRINGGVQVVAGTLLAIGKLPRLAATALALSLIPTTWAGHRFWEQTDKQQKRAQTIHFLKNLGLLGGLVYAANDTGGRPSITWAAKRAATKASRKASKKAANLSHNVVDLVAA